MNYLKFFNTKGNNIAKFENGGDLIDSELKQTMQENPTLTEEGAINLYRQKNRFESQPEMLKPKNTQASISANLSNLKSDPKTGKVSGGIITTTNPDGTTSSKELPEIDTTERLGDTSSQDLNSGDGGVTGGLSGEGYAAIGQAAQQAFNAIDGATMGDKNFSASSQAIDTVVHGASSALIQSGNPYAMAAGVALEGLNFATKAGGKNVQGFDVDIASSGYGNLGHKESEAGRVWDSWSGATSRKLAKRNEEARMALAAADVAQEQKFEQESRMNSVDNVLRQNQIALSGGIDTSLLAAKRGAKLKRIEEYRKKHCVKAKEGAKLKSVELSDDKNIVPTGDLHKNKHDIDLEHITSKGVPVITVNDDTVDTFTEIKQQEDSIVQHAEIETGEVILNKTLTDYIEDLRKKWHDSDEKDSDILLEVGKRLTKELLFNTEDKDKVIGQQEEKL